MNSQSVEDTRVVGATTEIALEQIAMEAPSAVHLLSLCAFLAPDDIPRRMLLAGAGEVPDDKRDPIRDSRALIGAVGVLNRYGVLEVQLDALGMHRTRQAAVRKRLSRRAEAEWATAAAEVVLHSYPVKPEPANTWPWAARLLPHAARAIDHLERLGIESLVAVDLRLRTARYLTYQSQLGSAETSINRALDRIQTLEPGGRLHARVLNQLAIVDREFGRFNQARRRATEALALHRKAPAASAHGREKPDVEPLAADDATRAVTTRLAPDLDVADALRNLGTIVHQQGDFDEALGLYDKSVGILAELYGAEGAPLAPLLESAFGVMIDQERWREATDVLQRALAIREATDGENSHEAMIDRFLVGMLTDPEGAVARATEIAAHLERAFGPRHPETAAGQRMLGALLRRRGELDEARRRFASAVDIHRANLGPRHYRVAASIMEFVPLAAAAGDAEDAERCLREAIAIILTAPPEEQTTTLRLSEFGLALTEAAGNDRSRPFVHRALGIIADATGDDEVIVAPARRMVVRALRMGGDVLLAAGRRNEAAAEYRHGLELARLTTETPLDDADFLLRLGFLAAVTGDAQAAIEHLREALACLADGEIPSPIWTIAKQCSYLASNGGAESVQAVLNTLFDEAKEDGSVTEFRGEITAMVPDGWFVKESTTLLSPDGQANIIASSEPLDPTIDTEQYATVQGDLLEKEFDDYKQTSFDRVAVLGDREGFLRSFEWTPPDGVRVAQTQIYYAEGGRGYTATATTPASNLPAMRLVLAQTLRGLSLARDASTGATARVASELTPVDMD